MTVTDEALELGGWIYNLNLETQGQIFTMPISTLEEEREIALGLYLQGAAWLH